MIFSHNKKIFKIFCFLLSVGFFLNASVSYAQLFLFSEKQNIKNYKIGKTEYRVHRIEGHPPHVQKIDISFRCSPKSSNWISYYYKYGMCNIEGVEFFPEDTRLKIKYFSHDLSKGDDYICETQPKYLEFELDNRCSNINSQK